MTDPTRVRHIVFLLPGDLNALTGGTLYDRRIIDGLRRRGWRVDLVALAPGFPWPDAAARDAAAGRVAALPDGSCVVADGLAFGAMPAIAQQHAHRLRWVALVHHPLALETGLDAAQRRQLFDSERHALAAARGVIVTSVSTARALAAYDVSPERVRVVQPGTRPVLRATARAARRRQATGISLLCVASVTPRKGHADLIDALAGLQDRHWKLHCVGSLARDPAAVHDLRARIDAHGLGRRVVLHGELGHAALQRHYAVADAFVLASHHEGYGMALAEALAHGLPVVSTTAGAIADTVPASAGMLVPPADVDGLRMALARLLDEPDWRASLAAGARAAAQQLPRWPQAVTRFAEALDVLADGTLTLDGR
ncbi:glycosyltransferase family 4 protein [Comamonadaceae bacterium G21597-S1]|nr:glycosyltransferase family 4 protein [Comamonadaceae bacterium G21597-S1]